MWATQGRVWELDSCLYGSVILKAFSGFLLDCCTHGELRCEHRMFASSHTELQRLLFQLLAFGDPTTRQLSGISFIYPLAKKQSFPQNYIGSFLTGAWPRGKAVRFKWEKTTTGISPSLFSLRGSVCPVPLDRKTGFLRAEWSTPSTPTAMQLGLPSGEGGMDKETKRKTPKDFTSTLFGWPERCFFSILASRISAATQPWLENHPHVTAMRGKRKHIRLTPI